LLRFSVPVSFPAEFINTIALYPSGPEIPFYLAQARPLFLVVGSDRFNIGLFILIAYEALIF
jgi:hypothetical protein